MFSDTNVVGLVNVNPWGLWIVNAQAISRGICFLLVRFMSGIGMFFGQDCCCKATMLPFISIKGMLED